MTTSTPEAISNAATTVRGNTVFGAPVLARPPPFAEFCVGSGVAVVSPGAGLEFGWGVAVGPLECPLRDPWVLAVVATLIEWRVL